MEMIADDVSGIRCLFEKAQQKKTFRSTKASINIEYPLGSPSGFLGDCRHKKKVLFTT